MHTGPNTQSFNLLSDAALTEEGVWLIDVRLRVNPTSEPLSFILDQARPALIDRILREALRGRSLGARSFRVHLDTGRQAHDFPLPETFLESRK